MRQRREPYDRRDTRELVSFPNGRVMTCDEYREGGAVPTMRAVDALPPEKRALVHEFGMDVWAIREWPVHMIRKALERAGDH